MRLCLSTVVLSLCAACSRPPAAPGTPAAEPPRDALLQNVTLRTWHGSNKTVEADAKTLTWRREASTFTATDVVARLPSKKGEVVMRAPRLDGTLGGDAFEATDGVTLSSARGEAQSPRAQYTRTPEGSAVTSDAGVRFAGPGQKLTARGFQFDVTEQHATFIGVETEVGGPR